MKKIFIFICTLMAFPNLSYASAAFPQGTVDIKISKIKNSNNYQVKIIKVNRSSDLTSYYILHGDESADNSRDPKVGYIIPFKFVKDKDSTTNYHNKVITCQWSDVSSRDGGFYNLECYTRRDTIIIQIPYYKPTLEKDIKYSQQRPKILP